jgi:hypothetical protein
MGSRIPFDPHGRREWARASLASAALGLKHSKDFAQVETYCFFVGYARSGHSVVGSLLNAHPEIVVANELDALQFVQRGFRRSQLFSMILARDENFGSMGRQWTGYDYSVPGQFQGRYNRLRVIGDKKGGRSSRLLGDDPGLLDRLRKLVRVPIRVIHVTRNPFDNIARMTAAGSHALPVCIGRYTDLCNFVKSIREQLSDDELVDIRYEDFVASPTSNLDALCKFVGVSADHAYLEDCTSIVSPTVRQSRDVVEWSSDDLRRVHELIEKYEFLQSYAESS